jgi:flagella basal body P-ring formation protein FlgA
MKLLLPLAAGLLAALPLHADDLAGILAPVDATASGAQTAKPGAPAQPAAATAAPRTLEEKDVLAALRQELTNRLGLDGNLQLGFTDPWGSLRIPATGDWKLTVTQLPPSRLASTAIVRFRIDVDGNKVGEWQTILRAQLWKPVWVASRPLDRGGELDPSLCSVQSVDVLREKQALVPAETDLSLYEMAQTVSQERPLAWRDISPRPLVRKGQTVEVVASEGSLHISMKGLALGSAGQGETVLVRNPDSRNSFTARVVSPNTVQVEF